MEKYLECHGTKMYLKEMTPEIEFLFEIFGDDFRTKNWILGHIDYIIKRMIYTLTEKDKNIIKAMYGLPKEKVSTDLDIDDKLPIDLDFSDEDVAKTFRGLRHPRRSKIVKGFREHYNNATSLRFVYEEIFEEIKHLLEYGHLVTETVYLKTIIDRYKLSIKIEKHELDADCNQKSESELDENFTSVTFFHDGERTVYNYFGYAQEKIIKSMFWNIMNICNNKELLIKSDSFSSKLRHFLLLKGYLYVEDVFQDIEILIQQFINFDENECADELKHLKLVNEEREDVDVDVYRINDAVKNKIEKYSEVPTVMDFINDSKGEDAESDIVEFAERLKEDFAERLNDDEDEIDDIDFEEDDEI